MSLATVDKSGRFLREALPAPQSASDDEKSEAWAFARALVLACAPALCAWGIEAIKEAIDRRRERSEKEDGNR